MAGRNRSALDGSGLSAEFARRLRELRDTSGLTVRQVAEKSGYSRAALSKAESGRGIPSWDLTAAFVQTCGQDPMLWRLAWEISRAAHPPLADSPGTSVAVGSAQPADPQGVSTSLTGCAAASANSDGVPAAGGEHFTQRKPFPAWPWIMLLATIVAVTIWVRADTASTPSTFAGVAAMTPRNYDVYACVGRDTPPSVRLWMSSGADWSGWLISHPVPWGVPQCEDQIWWAPYLNSGANPANRFTWTFTTSMASPSMCSLWGYSPPPPSGHAGRTAHYMISDGTGPTSRTVGQVRVSQADLKGSWYSLGSYQITTGLITVTLDNSGSDLIAKHGVIAGPIHVSCIT